MTFNSHKLALAAAGSMAIWYTVCTLFCVLWPHWALQLTADVLHMSSLDHLMPLFHITLINYISGLIQSCIYAYLFVWPMAAIYNLLVRK